MSRKSFSVLCFFFYIHSVFSHFDLIVLLGSFFLPQLGCIKDSWSFKSISPRPRTFPWSLCKSIHSSIYPTIFLTTHPSIHINVYLCIMCTSVSIHTSICHPPSIYPTIHLFNHHPSIHLSFTIHLFVHHSSIQL